MPEKILWYRDLGYGQSVSKQVVHLVPLKN